MVEGQPPFLGAPVLKTVLMKPEGHEPPPEDPEVAAADVEAVEDEPAMLPLPCQVELEEGRERALALFWPAVIFRPDDGVPVDVGESDFGLHGDALLPAARSKNV